MPEWPRKRWHEMTTADFADLDPRTIAVLPVAAIEQHGPHLPVWVDARINAGILDAAFDRLPRDLPVTALPPLPVGTSEEHSAFPGTLSLSAETLIRVWAEVGACIRRAGVTKLLIFNSHGGQPQILDIVARRLRSEQGMFVVAASWWGLGVPAGLFPDVEWRHGIHAGGVETSMMMHLAPELVRDAERADFVPSTVAEETAYRYLRAEGGGVGYGWMVQDLHPSGACGNALDADAERGRRLVEHAADALIGLLTEIDRHASGHK